MSTIKVQGIVLKTTDYKEHDKMLSLLTPEFGKLDVLIRGVKRTKSAFVSSSELFSLSEFILYQKNDHQTVTGCTLIESFYPIREDYEKFLYASYLLEIAHFQAQPQEQSLGLFTLLLRSLKRICYTDIDISAITSAYLLLDSALLGYRPMLYNCPVCLQDTNLNDLLFFDFENGGVMTKSCLQAHTNTFSKFNMRVNKEQIEWMRSVLSVGIEKNQVENAFAPLLLLKKYVEFKLEMTPKTKIDKL